MVNKETTTLNVKNVSLRFITLHGIWNVVSRYVSSHYMESGVALRFITLYRIWNVAETLWSFFIKAKIAKQIVACCIFYCAENLYSVTGQKTRL